MNWIEVLKKGDKEFVVNKTKDKVEKVEDIIEQEIFKNTDEEFEYKYNSIIIDIKIIFEDHIDNYYLPFLNKITNLKYNLYDFIKEHCEEYDKINESVIIDNKLIQDDIDKEQREIQEELEDDIDLYDN
jgi:hypothetical protein